MERETAQDEWTVSRVWGVAFSAGLSLRWDYLVLSVSP